MIQLNLLPDVKKEFIRAQRTRNLVISVAILVTIVAVGLTVLLGFTVYGAQALYSGFLSNEITKHNNELKSKDQIDKYLTIQNQLSNIDQLHVQKYVYSRALDYLKQINPSDPDSVSLSTANLGSEENSMTIEGSTRDYASLQVFTTTLSNVKLQYKKDGKDVSEPLFTSVTLAQASIGQTDKGMRAGFKINMTFTAAAFDTATENPTLSVPSMTTSDADRNTPKQQPFNETQSTTEGAN